MFSTFKQRLILGIYVFILLSIPTGTFLASQITNTKSSASEQSKNKPLATNAPRPATTSPAKELLSISQSKVSTQSAGSSSSSDSSSPTVATSFGPTLSLKASLEGRSSDQSTKLFVGILEGDSTSNLKFVLNFSVNLPSNGEYSNLSLAGLTPGSKYTAILKGSAQIATASAFIMSPNITSLNSGDIINMLSGDLNEDNAVNSSDYSIAKAILGVTSKSAHWNESVDFNKDGIINSFDLAIITKNLGQIGASGAWTSPIPVATASASLDENSPQVGSPDGDPGYWIWVPK